MIVINQWAGLATNASPYSIKPGAAVTQVNLQSLRPGSMVVRDGLTSASFTTHTGSTAAVVQVFHYQHGTTPHIVYQNASGRIYVGKGPS
jgi:hypothetical protein